MSAPFLSDLMNLSLVEILLTPAPVFSVLVVFCSIWVIDNDYSKYNTAKPFKSAVWRYKYNSKSVNKLLLRTLNRVHNALKNNHLLFRMKNDGLLI